MAANRKLTLTIVGDTSSLERTLRSATSKTSGFGKAMNKLGKGMQMAGLAITAGFIGAVKYGMDALKEQQGVMAQTEAALKSTGATAWTSAKGVNALADSIARKTGIDDMAIQKGANLLLTFTNIQNKAGDGNAIFSQATQILTDMSVALGTDATTSAIQLGKALNDPIKGITALTRVGVTFTQGQKDQIKAMVEAGDTMGAQKVILAELNKEFGGSAEAFGETFQGKINKVKEQLEGLAIKLAERVLPYAEKVTAEFGKWLAKLEAMNPAQQKQIEQYVIWAAVAAPVLIILGSLAKAITSIITLGSTLANPYVLAIAAITTWVVLWKKLSTDLEKKYGNLGIIFANLIAGPLAMFIDYTERATRALLGLFGVRAPQTSAGARIGVGGSGGGTAHADGLDYVPYDNYPAILHKGEAVLTAKENRQSGTVNIYGGINLPGVTNAREFMTELQRLTSSANLRGRVAT